LDIVNVTLCTSVLTIDRRIAALESSASDDTMKIVIVEDGETQAEALKRAG